MIVIVAKLKAIEGKGEELAGICLGLAKEVREKEKDCLMYDPHVSANNTGEIVIIEKYSGPEALNWHRKTSYFKEASKQMGNILAGPPEITVLNSLG